MEREIEALICWYKQQKSDFVSVTYLDKSTLIKKIFIPYSNWDKAEILEKEVSLAISVLAKLKTQLSINGVPISKGALLIIILALKNRTEYVSNQADFFPVFCTLIIFYFTFLTMAMPIFIKLPFAFLIFMVVTLLLQSRLKTRLHLAHTKELINILEQYKNEHT